MWLFAGTQRHTACSRARRLTHPCKYIFTPPVTCSQQLSLFHKMNISLIKNFLSSIFSFQKLLTCESHEVKDQIAPVKQIMLMEMT